jgi:hypothetical protein
MDSPVKEPLKGAVSETDGTLSAMQPRYWTVAATTVAVIAVVLIAVWPHEVPKSSVRVRNASDVVLHNVVVGNVHYGDISAGESSAYESWGPAYPHPKIEFDVDGQQLRQIPDDHVGENVLGPGQFTYVVTVARPKSEADFAVVAVQD